MFDAKSEGMLRRSDSCFFVGMALAIVLINVVMFTIAFLRTNIAEELHSTWVRAHALAFAAWVLLFLMQSILVASRRQDMHRELGIAGVYLAALMIILTIMSGIGTYALGAPRPAIDTFMLSVVVHVDMVTFTVLVTAGLLFRRLDLDIHKRLMLLATIAVGWRSPVFGRFSGLDAMLGAKLPHYVDQVALVVVAILYDMISRKRVNPAYIWGGLVILVLPSAADFAFRYFVPHLVAPQ